MYNNIKSVTDTFETNIPIERQEKLLRLSHYISEKVAANKIINLNFICTHNSRRSHLSQIWAQVAADAFNVKNVYCYSGGTEATGIYKKVIQTLENQGFKTILLCDGSQKYYAIKYGEANSPIIAFSKKYNDDFNPGAEFAAIMTCNHADQNCPYIPNAELRLPISFTDPKAFDDTPEVDQKYKEKSLEIGSEMFFIFKNVMR